MNDFANVSNSAGLLKQAYQTDAGDALKRRRDKLTDALLGAPKDEEPRQVKQQIKDQLAE